MLSSVAPPTIDSKTEHIIYKSSQILNEELGMDVWSAPAKYILWLTYDLIDEKVSFVEFLN